MNTSNQSEFQTAHQVRQAFKALGYNVSIRTNPFSPTLAGLYVSGRGLHKFPISPSTVMGVSTYQAHRPMFELALKVSGQTLHGQKIT